MRYPWIAGAGQRAPQLKDLTKYNLGCLLYCN